MPRRPDYTGVHYAQRTGIGEIWIYRAPCGAPIRRDEQLRVAPSKAIKYTLNKEQVTCLKCKKRI
jgi:hypothetical protein